MKVHNFIPKKCGEKTKVTFISKESHLTKKQTITFFQYSNFLNKFISSTEEVWKKPKNPIYRACIDGDYEFLKKAINRGDFIYQRLKNKALFHICQNHRWFCLNMFLKSVKSDLFYGFYGACKGGHVDLIKIFIEMGVDDWDKGLFYACIGGHPKAINIMIEKGAKSLESAFYGACYGGNVDIINIIIKMGKLPPDCLHTGLKYACEGGNFGAVSLMLEMGAHFSSLNFQYACKGGNIQIVKSILKNVKIVSKDYDWGMYRACLKGHLEIVKIITPFCDLNVDTIRYACSGKNPKVVEFVLERVCVAEYELQKILDTDECQEDVKEVIKRFIY